MIWDGKNLRSTHWPRKTINVPLFHLKKHTNLAQNVAIWQGVCFCRSNVWLVVIPKAPSFWNAMMIPRVPASHVSVIISCNHHLQKNRSRKRWFLTARSIQFSLTTKILPRVLKDSICEASKIVVVVVLDSDSPSAPPFPLDRSGPSSCPVGTTNELTKDDKMSGSRSGWHVSIGTIWYSLQPAALAGSRKQT